MSGPNKADSGVVIGLVQPQLPQVVTVADLAAQTAPVVDLVAKAPRYMATMDLVLFPEYMLHGLSVATNPALMCRMDGPEVAALTQACIDNTIWGCFSIMENISGGYPYNTGLLIDDQGEVPPYYRKMQPWVPVEPWEPGNLCVPVCDGPKGAKIGLMICYDGMFPEMSCEADDKGAEAMIRTAGDSAAIDCNWRFDNQSNSFCSLTVMANVCMCGADGTFRSMGEGMTINFDGTVLAHGTSVRADEIITAKVRPDLIQKARTSGGVENNPCQFGHRSYVSDKGGKQDCPYTCMTDLAAGADRVPWEDTVPIADGMTCGFLSPNRVFGQITQEAAE